MNNNIQKGNTKDISTITRTVNSEASIQFFLNQTKQKIEIGQFQSKEELLKHIHDFDTLMKKEKKDKPLELQQFEKQIKSLLSLYDQKYGTQEKDYSNLTEITRDDGTILSNYKTQSGENITLEQMKSNDSIKEQMDDMYNQVAAKNAGAIKENIIESNYRELQQKQKIEVNFEKIDAQTNPAHVFTDEAVTPAIDALRWYVEKQGMNNMQYTADGLARDEKGTIYEANIRKDGNIYISKTKTQQYSPDEKKTSRTLIDVYTPSDMKENIESSMQPVSDIDSFFLDTLMEQITMPNGQYSPDYKQILETAFSNTTPPLNEKVKQAYIEAVETRMLYGKEREMNMKTEENQMTYVEKPKTLVYKNENPTTESRSGFINAFLLTIITVLFGTLCTMYMFLGILDHI